MRRLGLYHHLLVGQAGKSFSVGTLRVVFSGCGCVLRLWPSRFPFFCFSRRRRHASRRLHPPLFLFPLILLSLCFVTAPFPLSSTSERPAVTADLFCRASPSPSARLPPPASESFPPSSCARMPHYANCPSSFFLDFRVSIMLT